MNPFTEGVIVFCLIGVWGWLMFISIHLGGIRDELKKRNR